LGLAPAAKARIADPSSIICDCKSGVSGAGRKAKLQFHYCERYERINAYRLEGHQHVCEVERELSELAGEDFRLTFTAHVLPISRGILSTLYANLREDLSEEDVIAIYRDFYKNSSFVKVFPSSSAASVSTQEVRGTNRAFLVVSVDRRTRRLRVVSIIDNLMKGQAGQAVQNMNIMFALPETAGLEQPGMYP
jgi:N-acetyl-gamma-glutamyl-phosphate reductase